MKSHLLLFLLFIALDLLAVDQWTQKANFGGIGRHRGAACASTNKGYMGFGHINSVVNIAFDDVWEYDPATDTWTQKADFGGGRRYHNLFFSVKEKVYAGLGRSESSTFDDFWEYDPTTNAWTQLNDFPGGSRLGPLSFIIEDVAYIGMGMGSGNENGFYKYDPDNDAWTAISDFPGAVRNTGIAFSLGGKGYVGTGSGSFGTGNDFWEYKPSTDQWLQRANVPGLPREGATAFAVKGRGYVFCGNDWSEDFDDVWEFNPGSNTWKQLDDFPGSGRRFMNGFSIHERGYCGSGTNGINFNDFWCFDPTGEPEGKILRENIEVNIFPNPSTDYINFEITSDLLDNQPYLTLNILDASGRVIHQAQIKDGPYSFERNHLRNGVYFYQINDGNNLLNSGKFIFQ
ncbi:MAG: T9SS type A sorting domain-containing protein [Saprospiraceae bacterium]|nr:T9SS type A sorting domain-containing protein [Saprospiraceae bacterium]